MKAKTFFEISTRDSKKISFLLEYAALLQWLVPYWNIKNKPKNFNTYYKKAEAVSDKLGRIFVDDLKGAEGALNDIAALANIAVGKQTYNFSL